MEEYFGIPWQFLLRLLRHSLLLSWARTIDPKAIKIKDARSGD
jgi:hypothetical protein